MMKKLFLLVCLSIFFVPSVTAQEGTDNLMELLNAVPDQPEFRESFITFVDYTNLFLARENAPQLDDLSDIDTLSEESEDIFFATLRGINSGPDFIQYLFTGGNMWEELIGFDFMDIDRAIIFGDPPMDHDILMGEFDPDAIETAFTNREYTSESLGDMTLWCSPQGCENGAQTDIENINQGSPFGGELGREQPVLTSDTLVASAVSDVGLILVEDAFADRVDSLADNPTYASAVGVIDPENLVIQGLFANPGIFLLDVAPFVMEGNEAVIEELMAEADRLPQYELIMIADTANEDEQVIYITLVYRDEADATTATEVIPERLETMDSLVMARPLQEMFDDRGITEITTNVIVDEDNDRALAVIEFRAPKATNEDNPETFGIVASSMVYRMFVQMTYQRDTAWLAAGTVEEE